jgi:hypothetical protein
MLVRYLNLDSKVGVWPLYGTFAALMCVGSTIGAISWIARMQELNYLYLSENDKLQDFSKFLYGERAFFFLRRSHVRVTRSLGQSLKYYWKAVFSVFYSLEFAFLSITKLLVLDRLVAFALPSSSADVASVALRYKLMILFRATIFAAITGDATGFGGNIASAVYCVKIGNLSGELRAVVLSNSSAPQPDPKNSPLVREILDTLRLNNRVQSVQLFSELAVLVVIVVVVASVGALCIRRIHDGIHHAQSAVPNKSQTSARLLAKVQQSARTLKLRVVRTVLVIFLAFTLRSAFAIMYVQACVVAISYLAFMAGQVCCRHHFRQHSWMRHVQLPQQRLQSIR